MPDDALPPGMVDFTPTINAKLAEVARAEALKNRHNPSSTARPNPLSEAAYHGIAGEFIRVVGPETESDPAALLFQLLAFAGNCFGSKAWFTIEATSHFPNLFAVVVGATSKSRKGTSEKWVRRLLREADPAWERDQTANGLSTGEGLIEKVRDPIWTKDKKGQDELADAGVTDKRLLVVEEEFQRVLRVMARESSILSAVLRSAWDGTQLGVMTRGRPIKATGAVISLVAHITGDELKAELSEIQMANGLGNRFLFCLANRSKLLPHGGNVDDHAFTGVARQLLESIKQCHPGRIDWDAIAKAQWADIYQRLALDDHPGMYGALTARSEAQICRVALIYALLDGQSHIGEAHLTAACEVIRYANDSVRYIFGDATGNRTADTIMDALLVSSEGLSRTNISQTLHRNTKAAEIDDALALLQRMGKAGMVTKSNGSTRPTQIWRATAP